MRMKSPSRPNAIFIILWFSVSGGLSQSIGWAQTPDSSLAESRAGDAALSPPGSTSSETQATMGANPGGLQCHVPGRWSTLAVNARNPTDVDSNQAIAVTIGDHSQVQYARELWVPAGARRLTWMPIRIPDDIPTNEPLLPFASIRLKLGPAGEQFQANQAGDPISKRSLLINHDQSVAAVVFDPPRKSATGMRLPDFLRSLVGAARKQMRLSEQELALPELSLDTVPSSSMTFDAVDQVIIGSKAAFKDASSLQRLSDWLRSGGLVWIMLDEVDPMLVARLLGDDFDLTIADSVELNEFELEKVDAFATNAPSNAERWSSERPAELLRVFTSSKDVSARVNGWPAAFWIPVGKGEVLVTTLSANGWFQDVQDVSPESPMMTAFRPIALRFFARRLEQPNHYDQMVPLVDQQIGYAIPKKSTIIMALAAHLLVLAGVGLMLQRIRQLHWLAVIVPVMAILASATLMGIGASHTQSVEATVASTQIATVSSDGSRVRTETVSAIYRPDRQPLPLTSSSVAFADPKVSSSEDEMRRIVWDDSGQGTWNFITQRPGVVSHVRTIAAHALSPSWVANGTFDERGFRVSVSGLSGIEDPVVVAPTSPSLALQRVKEDGEQEFAAGASEILPSGRFIQDGLVSREQQSRQSFLASKFAAQSDLEVTSRSLLAWTKTQDLRVSFGDGYHQTGWTLAELPIHIGRPNSGDPYFVPATFVRLDSFALEKGVSMMFDPRTGRWLEELTKAKTITLQCSPPKELAPCQITRAVAGIHINAPSRTLTVSLYSDSDKTVVFEKANPTGPQEFEFEIPSSHQREFPGQVILEVSVSPEEGEEDADSVSRIQDQAREDIEQQRRSGEAKEASRSVWSIRNLQVSVHATASDSQPVILSQ